MEQQLVFDDGNDPSTFFQKKGMSFKEIVLNYLARIGTYAAVEMRGGFWQKTQLVVNNQIISNNKYVSDSREIYMNAVHHLSDLIYSYFHESMEDNHKKFITSLKNLETEYNDKKDEESIKEYMSKKLDIYRLYFRDMNSFLKDVNYLDTVGFTDE